MARPTKLIALTVAGLLAAAGFMLTQAQENQLPVSDPNCTFFGPNHDKFVPALNARVRGELTMRVMSQLAMSQMAAVGLDAASAMPGPPGGSRTDSLLHPNSSNTIDKYIFQALADAQVAPAPPTTDFEFVRRVYLDLTGRIPTPEQALGFVNDTSPDKRTKLVDSLVGSPNWLDKWTVWYGDLLKNNSRNTQIVRFVPGVLAFNNFIRG